MHDTLNVSGIIWNHITALRKRYYRLFGQHLSSTRLQEHVAKLRRRTHHFSCWQRVGSQAVHDICQRHDNAYKRFFKKEGGLPRFKKVKQYTSFTLKQSGWKLGEDERTTQKCSGCGHGQKLALNERVFCRESCGLVLDRDHNAARNIVEAGHRLILSQSVEVRASSTASGVHGRSPRL